MWIQIQIRIQVQIHTMTMIIMAARPMLWSCFPSLDLTWEDKQGFTLTSYWGRYEYGTSIGRNLTIGYSKLNQIQKWGFISSFNLSLRARCNWSHPAHSISSLYQVAKDWLCWRTRWKVDDNAKKMVLHSNSVPDLPALSFPCYKIQIQIQRLIWIQIQI